METKFFLNFSLKFSFVFFFIFKNTIASSITGYELKILIEDWLKKNGNQANITILKDLKYPACKHSNIFINDISGNSKLIKVNCVGENPWQFIVRNKLNIKKQEIKKQEMSKFYALKNYKDKGSIIFEEDLVIIKTKNRIKNKFISDKLAIIGKKLKKSVKPNQLLRYSNLENDWLIEKNSLVTIVNNKGFITIKEEGLAMNDANFMDTIKVKNVKSGKIIVGYAKNKKKVILNTKQN